MYTLVTFYAVCPVLKGQAAKSRFFALLHDATVLTDGMTEYVEKCSGFATMTPVPECGHGCSFSYLSPVR